MEISNALITFSQGLRRRRPVSPAEDKKSESSTTPLSASELQETLLERFTNAAHWNYTHGCPAADQLSTLTRVNVYRAYLHNIALIGLSPNGLCEAEILSPFNGMRPWTSTKTSLPPALQPTETQVFQAHHPWLDFFPHPKARDNLIREQDNYDEDELCLDILGFWNNNVPENMLLVWGEPSIPGNWEVTELFIEKWGWVIHGCPELLQSTNEWRARRGEKPILRYI
ncbi:hypothetical protein BJX66DRAFT_320305 [Aspergillus keveii]|uniref:Uncharacterized protein n=1 Tax=Aspergillus keveii TaxID=714993 RepID=A0ABR4FH87_9EURO